MDGNFFFALQKQITAENKLKEAETRYRQAQQEQLQVDSERTQVKEKLAQAQASAREQPRAGRVETLQDRDNLKCVSLRADRFTIGYSILGAWIIGREVVPYFWRLYKRCYSSEE